ncbi:MAG: hypothetical protein WBO31_15010 [Saprospiraceae bacterium]
MFLNKSFSTNAKLIFIFWSGADFEEDELKIRGKKFKNTSAFFTAVEQINAKDPKRWLQKFRDIHWDYKNKIKR